MKTDADEFLKNLKEQLDTASYLAPDWGERFEGVIGLVSHYGFDVIGESECEIIGITGDYIRVQYRLKKRRNDPTSDYRQQMIGSICKTNGKRFPSLKGTLEDDRVLTFILNVYEQRDHVMIFFL